MTFKYNLNGAAGYYNLSTWLERARALQSNRIKPRLITYINARGEKGFLATPNKSLMLKRIGKSLESAPCPLQWIIDRLAAAERAPVVNDEGEYQQSRYYHQVWAALICLARQAQEQGKTTPGGSLGSGQQGPLAWAYVVMSTAVDPNIDPQVTIDAIEAIL
jgi:hypothetical protein